MGDARRKRRATVAVIAVACGVMGAATARAETCPDDEPTWIGGRVVVDEPNMDPPGIRGVGEVFVYAYERGDSATAVRTMAVTDGDGYFCIHDTHAADWVVTCGEPFTFRPFVMEVTCSEENGCDLGEIRIDEHMLRISDDYVDYVDGWWGGPFAQTIVMPSDAESMVKLSVRSATGSVNDVVVLEGQGLEGTVVGQSALEIPDNAGGGRGTAVFPPGEARVEGGQVYTVELGGGSAVWRLSGDGYGDGAMFDVSGTTLTERVGEDMCLTLGVDGPDGLYTSYLVPNQDGYIVGSTITQSFVARSDTITHAHFVVGSPCDECRIQASIGETPDGPAIGPVKEMTGIHEQGVAFAWFADEVPVTRGETYHVRYHFPDGWSVAYTSAADPLGQDHYAGGEATADGVSQGVDLWGRVMGPRTAVGDDDDDAAGDDDAGDDDAAGDDDVGAPGDVDAGGEGGCGCSAAGWRSGPSAVLAAGAVLLIGVRWRNGSRRRT